MANSYGGGDPKVVYARVPLGEAAESESNSLWRKSVVINLKGSIEFQYSMPYGNDKYAIKHLIVAGVPYTLKRDAVGSLTPFGMQMWTDWKVLPLDLPKAKQPKKHWWMRDRDFAPDGKQNEWLITLSQRVGHPVFIIDRIQSERGGVSTVTIEGTCPNLGELGFASIKSAEQTYQDLSYFVGNTMLTPTPDNMPVVKQSDKEKILAHGLDVRYGFRHRKA